MPAVTGGDGGCRRRCPRSGACCGNWTGQALAAAFGAWLTAQVLAGPADARTLMIALDGKTVRGALAGDQKAPHLLAAMITGARAVIAQKDVDAKTNEITQVRPLLDDIDITGALVLADSGYVHRDAGAWAVPLRAAGAQLVQPGVRGVAEEGPAGRSAYGGGVHRSGPRHR